MTTRLSIRQIVTTALRLLITDDLGAIGTSEWGSLGQALTVTSTGVAFIPFSGGDTTPTGLIIPFAPSVAPTDWMLCDGSLVSRTDYSALFAVIGETYGVGDGSTTFALPDFRGRMPLGSGTGTGLTARVLGEQSGSETVVLTEADLASHTHTWSYKGGTASYLNTYKSIWINTTSGNMGATGGGGEHNNMMPYTVTNFIIKT